MKTLPEVKDTVFVLVFDDGDLVWKIRKATVFAVYHDTWTSRLKTGKDPNGYGDLVDYKVSEIYATLGEATKELRAYSLAHMRRVVDSLQDAERVLFEA